MSKAKDENSRRILEFVAQNPGLSSSQIHEQLELGVELVTVKRNLTDLVKKHRLRTIGRGRGTRYLIDPSFKLFAPINMERYFTIEQDDREIIERFDIDLLTEVLPQVDLFTADELRDLHEIHNKYRSNISKLSTNEYRTELERLSIDLSWKSSQIEGNTYTLLETEALIKEQKEAVGKKKEEAIMLLNHKDAMDYILDEPNYIAPISLSKLEEIHRILTKNLHIDPNIRSGLVRITGTNYKPLDNEFQIKEAIEAMCTLVNQRESVFEKALLLLVVISYIQAFSDGNKRTARIVSNAILINEDHCPLSFRTVDSTDYKKAMLLFYEQNNITALKEIFMEQYQFAVKTYFN